jgi:hypothetical protein
LSVGGIGYPGAPEVYHLLELVQMAAGETPQRRIKSRARLLLMGVMRNQLSQTLSGRRFQPGSK